MSRTVRGGAGDSTSFESENEHTIYLYKASHYKVYKLVTFNNINKREASIALFDKEQKSKSHRVERRKHEKNKAKRQY